MCESFVMYLDIVDKFKQEETFKPDFYNYSEGQFKNWRWTWNWNWSQSQKAWIIDNLQARCPNCDTPMIDYSSIHGLYFECPRCNYKARDSQCEEPHKIERIILDDIERQRKNKSA
jgi:hypothetical protein